MIVRDRAIALDDALLTEEKGEVGCHASRSRAQQLRPKVVLANVQKKLPPQDLIVIRKTHLPQVRDEIPWWIVGKGVDIHRRGALVEH